MLLRICDLIVAKESLSPATVRVLADWLCRLMGAYFASRTRHRNLRS